jgi:uncharacterized protein
MPIDFDQLWQRVKAQFHAGQDSIHGPAHWLRVERNGLLLADRTGADETIVRLFALFHDSCRVNDGHDPAHGHRGAELAASLRGTLFDLPDPAFELLHHACWWHTEALNHANPTIGTCWDADRLDLGRVGITPHERYMSTEFGRELARSGGSVSGRT